MMKSKNSKMAVNYVFVDVYVVVITGVGIFNI